MRCPAKNKFYSAHKTLCIDNGDPPRKDGRKLGRTAQPGFDDDIVVDPGSVYKTL